MKFGPVEPHLQHVAVSVASWMRSNGLTPPPEHALVPALLVSLLIILIGAGFLATLILSSPRSARDAVLIVGASPAITVAPAPGKTTLFHVLRLGHVPPYGTVPSQDANEAVFAPSSRLRVADSTSEEAEPFNLAGPIKWVDFPGHARLRPLLPERIAEARAIVFVIDASPVAFSRTLRDSTDLLYDILTHSIVVKMATPVLLFCNKTDMPSCLSPSDVRARLEAELERARKAKYSALDEARNATIGPSNNGLMSHDEDDRPALGYDNDVFSFDHIPNDVSFAGGSAKLLDVSAVCAFVGEHF